jgi:NAD(P)-dependent dehydrogenase (short-subunit alcohol dehydrogenase family)
MAKIFITGSADGLGLMAAKSLMSQGHQVVLHARNAQRAEQTRTQLPEAKQILVADLSNQEETKNLAAEVNKIGIFDAIIHNAGVYQVANKIILAVNTLAPYILTCLIERPKRLIYLGSDMHLHGDPDLRNLANADGVSYSDSKFQIVLFSMAVAREWSDVYSNAVDPGWVPTRMGGPGAPDDLTKGSQTQEWLAVSDEATAKVSGHYFHHKKDARFKPEAKNVALQDKFVSLCEKLTGVAFPRKSIKSL